jgi:hypothetical protein
MPAIAKESLKHNIRFYWHLGDLRAIDKIDEDLAHDSQRKTPVTVTEYQSLAWKDFIDSQLKPFGLTPVFVSVGNHEIQRGHTREEFNTLFRPWLDSPPIHFAKVADGEGDGAVVPYNHWIQDGVDFISLDNATHDQFDETQMTWFKKVLSHDEGDETIKTIVVGMHEALPESISRGHSMSESKDSPVPEKSGREVYQQLLRVKNGAKKNVYVLASHSHFYMEGIFNTPYWQEHGGILPGWIVGTAGAVRYTLPKEATDAIDAKTNVYGYLLATVQANKDIRFQFELIKKSDVPKDIVKRYGPGFIDFCFNKNSSSFRPE